MRIQKYWPTPESIDSCIKTEAETAHESLILAVHQSYPLLKRSTNESNLSETSVTEHELLQAFLTPHLPTGTLLLPITGQSGVGKSHMIRWLNAQIRRSKAFERMHVIRIPKSASLRKIVQLILSPLKGAEYDQLRSALQRAAAEVTPEDAGIRLRSGLELSLRTHFIKLQQAVKEAPQSRNTLFPEMGHTQKLPSLFNDPALSSHYDPILSGIIMRAVAGSKNGEAQLAQFKTSDLVLPSDFELSDAGIHARKYYVEQLTQDEHLEKATTILNKVIDDAISHAFNIGQSLGGKTLQDIFLEIREKLHIENKELVLLVEDFAALAGIQDPLLKICIQEAIRDGEQVLCTMRTAIAVTDGDWSGRDTVLTRAQHQWVVASQLNSNEETLDRVSDLVGSYLNAARHGSNALEEMFNNSQSDTDKDLQAWITAFEDENLDADDETTLQAFGRCQKGYWLFPFNRMALDELAKQHFTRGNSLVFNPRWIINSLLRKVLLMRDFYEGGKFPPADFEDARASVFSAQLISRTNLHSADKKRYESLLRFWGGNPTNDKALEKLPSRVSTAFSLAPLQGQTTDAIESRRELEPEIKLEIKPEYDLRAKSKGEEETKEKDDVAVESALISKWRDTLEEWVNGIELKQSDANKLRGLLTSSVRNFANWNAYFLSKTDITTNVFWIPNARGNPTSNYIEVANDHRDSDGSLRRSILALLRYDESGGWNYPGGDEDSIYFANLIHCLSEKVLKYLRDKADEQIVIIAQCLIWCNHVLGGSKRLSNNEVVPLLESIWNRVDHSVGGRLDPAWSDLLDYCEQAQMQLLKEIDSRCAAFQGAGDNPFAIDFSRIVNLLSVENIYNDISSEDINEVFRGEEIRPVLQRLATDLKPIRLKVKLANTIKYLQLCQSAASDSFEQGEDQSALVPILTALIDEMQSSGRGWPKTGSFEKTPRQLKYITNKFKEINIGRLLKCVGSVLEEYESQNYYNSAYALSNVSVNEVKDFEEFLTVIDQFLNITESITEDVYIALQENDSGPVVDQISVTFSELEKSLEKFTEVNNVVIK